MCLHLQIPSVLQMYEGECSVMDTFDKFCMKKKDISYCVIILFINIVSPTYIQFLTDAFNCTCPDDTHRCCVYHWRSRNVMIRPEAKYTREAIISNRIPDCNRSLFRLFSIYDFKFSIVLPRYLKQMLCNILCTKFQFFSTSMKRKIGTSRKYLKSRKHHYLNRDFDFIFG